MSSLYEDFISKKSSVAEYSAGTRYIGQSYMGENWKKLSVVKNYYIAKPLKLRWYQNFYNITSSKHTNLVLKLALLIRTSSS